MSNEAGLKIENVRKSYGVTPVLDGVSLTMAPREFTAFLGPSGSGKSTLLRIIAGLETLDSGEVWLAGRRIDGLAPGARNVAMVFQQYALYPHMTVRENMAFGLRNQRVAADEIAARIAQVATALEIEPLLARKPGQLSGGQRQRVAIGRAIVKQPALFLLDEPLSNLDAALRNRTRVELAQLRTRMSAAFIMVTHDQAEAMTLADRIVVIHDRRIQQVGAPMEIYSRPANRFVAGFVGSPAIALLPAMLEGSGPLATIRLENGAVIATSIVAGSVGNGRKIEVGMRPEHVAVVQPGTSTCDGEAILVERLGDRSFVHVRLDSGHEAIAIDTGLSDIAVGDRIGLRFDGAAVHLFTADGSGHHPGGVR